MKRTSGLLTESRAFVFAALITLSGIMAASIFTACSTPDRGNSETTPESTRQVTSTSTLANTPTLEPTLTERARALELAEAGVTVSADWTAYTEEIGGVLMALVPAGCFQMGAEDGDTDEVPVHEVCFEEPFWIDVHEVTNEQYGSTGCEDFSPDLDQPHNCVGWTDALAYCESRGARLPTEAEWEYAARGPDGLAYPWGNTFVEDNVVYNSNSGRQPAPVGSRPGGISWVGALDMSGNVWEWVNDWYSETYYSTLADGAVNPPGPAGGTYRVHRGGSFLSGGGQVRAAERTAHFEAVDDGFRCALSYNP